MILDKNNVTFYLCIITILMQSLCFGINTTSESNNPFNKFMSPSSGVDLFSGTVVQPIPLISLPSSSGSSVNVTLAYSSNVLKNARARNDYGPTGWCGLGWQLGFATVICDHKATKTLDDDEYFFRSEMGTGEKIYEKNGNYFLKNNPYWKVERIINNSGLVDGWIITSTDGTKYKYGNVWRTGANATEYTFYWSASNFVGAGFQGTPELYPYKWSLNEVVDPYGNKIMYDYDPVNITPSGGWTTKQYTQATYLKKITNPDGYYVTFQTAEKNEKEYLERGYMGAYEKKYLESIKVYNPNDQILNQYFFCYKIINNEIEGMYAKRLLTDVTEYNGTGAKIEKVKLTYNDIVSKSEDDQYPYGALESVKLPSCGKVTYKYDNRKKLDCIKTLSQLDGEFGLDHKIAMGTFDNNNEFVVILDGNKKLWLYYWDGANWVEKFSEENFGNSRINNICAGNDFFAFTYNSGQKVGIMQWNGKEWIRKQNSFDDGNDYWPNTSDNSGLIAGNGFLVRYNRNTNSNTDDELDIFTITDYDVYHNVMRYTRNYDTEMRVQVGFNTVSVEMKYVDPNDDTDPNDFYVYKRTGPSNWQEFIPPAFPHPKSDATLNIGPEGNYFILWYAPGSKDFVYFYNWDGEKWNNAQGRQQIGGYGNAKVYTGNNYIVIRHKGSKYITVFDLDGTTWQKTIDAEKVTNTGDINIHPSADYFVITYPKYYYLQKTNDALIRVYYKNGADGKWKKNLFGDFNTISYEKSVVCGTRSFAVLVNSEYFRGALWTFTWDSRDTWNQTYYSESMITYLIRDGKPAYLSSFSGTGDAFYMSYNLTEEGEPENYAGMSRIWFFKKYQDNYKENVYYAPVSTKIISDELSGSEMITEYKYDENASENSNYDTQNGSAKFNKVETVIPGNGKTVTWFYNEKQSGLPAYMSDKLNGIAYKNEIFSETDPNNAISSSETYHDIYPNPSNTNNNWPDAIIVKRVTGTKNKYKNIITRQSFSEFDPNNGSPAVSTNTVDGNSSAIISNKSTFAYTKYQKMADAHMFSQQCENSTYSKYGYADEKVLSKNVTTWSEIKGALSWVPYSKYVWNTSTDENGYPDANSDFNFLNPENNSNTWEYTGCVNHYTDNGIPLETKNANNVPSCVITGYKGTQKIASVANASFQECGIFTGDYDDGVHSGYYDYENGWKKGGSELNTSHTHFGKASVHIQINDAGLSKDLTVSKKDYVFSCWVYSGNAGTIKLQVLENGTEINSSEATKVIPANKWVRIERKISAETLHDNQNVTIKISTNVSDIYVDDIRFCPGNSFVTTTFYDQFWRAPVATVDANNSAAYIEYDNEGRPVLWRNNSKAVMQTKEYNKISCVVNNTDATLKDITLSDGAIDFDPLTTNYHIYLTNSIDKIEYTPIVSDPDATITINGTIIPCPCGNPLKIDLPQGTTTVNMEVTAPNGIDNNIYNLEFERLSSCWSIIGNRGISSGEAKNIQLKTASDGTQYLAYRDNGNGGKVIVKKRVNNNWILVGGEPVSEGKANGFSLSFSGSTPWVAYSEDFDNVNDDLTDRGVLQVKKMENGTWVTVGGIIEKGVSGSINLVHNATTSYIAYNYTVTVGDDENSFIKVKTYDGTSWANLGTDGIVSDEGGSSIHLRTGSLNTLYIGYIHEDTNNDNDTDAGKLFIKKYNGASWVELNAITNKTVNNFDMEIAGSVPYVVFGESDINNDGNSLFKVYAKKYVSNSWTQVGTDYLFKTDDNGSLDLNLDNVGVPFLAFANNDNRYYASVLRFDSNNGVWESVGNPCFIRSNQMCSMSLDFNAGNTYFAIQDQNYNNKVSFVTYQSNQCSRAVLNSLVIDGIQFQPDFRHYIVNYNTTVGALTEKVSITASSISGTTVKIGDTYLHPGLNSIPVIVTGSDSKTQTKYTLNITKPLSATASICSFELFDKNMNSLSYTPGFSSSINDYFITVPQNIDKVIIKLTSHESTLKINGSTSDKMEIPVFYGIAIIPLEAVAPDGKNSVRYTLTIKRRIPDNLALTSLTIPSVTLNPPFNPADRETYTYTATVSNSTNQITITPVARTGTIASINGNTNCSDPINLKTGLNDLLLNVKHPTSGSVNYNLKIIRTPSNASGLSSIVLKDNNSTVIPVTPVFNVGKIEYKASIASTVSSVEIAPVALNTNAIIKVNNSSLVSGKTSIIPQTGINNIDVSVTSASPAEETVYHFNVIKQKSINVPEVGFTTIQSSKKEGDYTIDIPVTVNGPLSQNASVDYVVSSVDADAGDYTLSSGTLQFSPCQAEALINLVIKDDQLTENNESITITLQNENNVTLNNQNEYIHTIIDNDTRAISFTEPTGFGIKSESSPVINVFIDPEPVLTQTFTIQYNVDPVHSTAQNGVDYTLGSGTLSFDKNNKIRQIPLAIINNGTSSTDKTVVITLSNPTGDAIIGNVHTFTYTIYGNEHILYVDALNGSTTGRGYSWSTAYKFLQDALSEARKSNGRVTEIRVAEGTYYPTNDLSQIDPDLISFQLIDNVTLIGGYPTGGGTRNLIYETILDGDIDRDGISTTFNSHHVVTGANTIIDGFTIRNGSAHVHGDGGAGIISIKKSLTVKYCKFTNNVSSGLGGAGIYTTGGTITCNNTRFENANAGTAKGGAILSVNNAVYVNDCNFVYNQINGAGGALCIEGGTLDVQRSTFNNNKNTFKGGAICLTGCTKVSINRSTFETNSVVGADGGAVFVSNCSGDIEFINTVFFDNNAQMGGAVFFNDDNNTGTYIKILNCSFSKNYANVAGGAVYNSFNCDNKSVIGNSIFWYNLASGNNFPDIFDETDIISVQYCDVENFDFRGTNSHNNIQCIPYLIPSQPAGMKLSSNSCCIDKADSKLAPNEDRAGKPRPQLSGFDIGAYEYEPPVGSP